MTGIIDEITAVSHPAALDDLAAKIRALTFDPDEYHIVLTPDRYTLGVEKRLFTGGGSLNCEVLTLSRLCKRVLPSDKILSREGSVMLVARAIKSVRAELKFYDKAVNYYDFARDVFATLLQLGSAGVTPAELAEKSSGATATKMRDLALIKAEYDVLKADYSDATDRLEQLIARVGESELIRKSHIYAIGYSDPTKLNRAVFSALAKNSKSFSMYVVKQPNDIAPRKKKIITYSVPDPVSQYKLIASYIRRYLSDDETRRCDDISVICPEPRALIRVLKEYGLPVYAEMSTPLDKTPPTAALAAAYRLGVSPTADDLVALAKNPFSGCDRADAEKLQSYLAEHNVSRGVFNIKITDDCAARACGRTKMLADKFKSAQSFAQGCKAIMDAAEFEKTGEALYEKRGLSDPVTPISSTLELLDRYGTGERETDAAAFFSAAHAVEIKSIPLISDYVTVCDAPSLRLSKCKLLFVADFNDGVLPSVTLDTGLIADAEIVQTGNVLEPTAREKNRRDRAELAAVINNADTVYCTYCTSAGGKSALLAAADVEDRDYVKERAVLNGASDKDKGDMELIVRYACCSAAARELSSRKMTDYSSALAAAADAADEKLGVDKARTSPRFESEIGAGIECGGLSSSELSTWFACPYKRFLRYSIGLIERKTGKLDAPDFGVIVHSFMEKFINEYIQTKSLDYSEERVSRLVDEALAEKGIDLKTEDEDAYVNLVADAMSYARDNVTVIERGAYKPVKTELKFRGKDVGITLNDGKTPFNGAIDRIDVCEDGGARIIDYKTGSKKFDIKKCLNGTDMQLPLYAHVARTMGYDVEGFFYMPMRPDYDADKEMLLGGFVRDVAVAKKADGELGNSAVKIVNANLKIDGSDFSRPAKNILKKEDFDKLIAVCVDNASVAAGEIGSGYVERAPIGKSCDFCPYGGLCDSKKFRTDNDGEDEEDEK